MRDFPGNVSNYIDAGTPAAVNITDSIITLSAWIVFDAALGRIAGRWGDTQNNRRYLIQIDSGSKANWVLFDTATNISNLIGGTTLSTGTLYHICGVTQPGTNNQRLYVNGVQDGVRTPTATPGTGGGAFRFGIDSVGGAPYNGRIGEVALWNAALTPEEVAALARGYPPYLVHPQGLRTYWPLAGRHSPEIDLISRAEGTIVGSVPYAENIVPIHRGSAFFKGFAGAPVAPTTDADTVYLQLIPSGTEEFTGALFDANTVPVLLTPSAVETFAHPQTTDAATAPLKLTPSSVDVGPAVDSNIVPVALTPSADERGPFSDDGTVPLTFEPYSVPGAREDAALVPLTLAPSGTEVIHACKARFTGTLLGWSTLPDYDHFYKTWLGSLNDRNWQAELLEVAAVVNHPC